MFSHVEMQAKARGAGVGSSNGGGGPMFDVRESLQALFVRTFEVGFTVAAAAAAAGCCAALCWRVSPGVG
jgi:hypothetical protein